MQYNVKVERDGRYWTATFLDAPGCATFASSRSKALANATEALEGWPGAHPVDGKVPLRPAPTKVPSPSMSTLSLRSRWRCAGLVSKRDFRRQTLPLGLAFHSSRLPSSKGLVPTPQLRRCGRWPRPSAFGSIYSSSLKNTAPQANSHPEGDRKEN